MEISKISIGSDHAGFSLKEHLKETLAGKGYTVDDVGCFNEERADYPDFAHAVARRLEKGEAAMGIIICGSGNGISMAANKHTRIRSAVCWNKEVAELARAHNDANVLALPARFVEEKEASDIMNVFLRTGFDGGRHEKRVEKIAC